MSLTNMNWSPVSMHNVMLAWLRAERDTHMKLWLSKTHLPSSEIAVLLDNPDLGNADHNRKRLRLLYWARNLFVLEIPLTPNGTKYGT